MKSSWQYTLAWLTAVFAALALAAAAPNESSVMGHLPSFMARTPDRQTMKVPNGLPTERTLALITFRGTQHAQIDGWVQGLRLKNDPSIAWLRMPVFNDPGSEAGRSAMETKLSRKYPTEVAQGRMVPVFTNRDEFVRAAGLNGTDEAYAVVFNRQGDVLARVAGAFDPDKAQNLLETLLRPDF